jgi:hypothetical protein
VATSVREELVRTRSPAGDRLHHAQLYAERLGDAAHACATFMRSGSSHTSMSFVVLGRACRDTACAITAEKSRRAAWSSS